MTTTRVGDYEIADVIGWGGMAIVYRAHQPRLAREIALKQLQVGARADLVERFVQEARMSSSLEHPNVVVVYDLFEHARTPYIAMEYLREGSLRPRLRRITRPQALKVLKGLLAGLAHAHRHGIVHRDLKPENLLVTRDGEIKIADFGIAKAYTSATRGLTETGQAIGTPAYMAPEQATGKPVGPATDLYAVGVIAYEMLLGRRPFDEAEDAMAMLLQHAHAPIRPPAEIDPDVDPRLVAWLERMLAKAPADRPADAAAAWRELEEIAVELLGPFWERDARLPERSEPGPPQPPPVPPPFTPLQQPAPTWVAPRYSPPPQYPPQQPFAWYPPAPVYVPAPPLPRRRRPWKRYVLLFCVLAFGGYVAIYALVDPEQRLRAAIDQPGCETAETNSGAAAAVRCENRTYLRFRTVAELESWYFAARRLGNCPDPLTTLAMVSDTDAFTCERSGGVYRMWALNREIGAGGFSRVATDGDLAAEAEAWKDFLERG